MLLGQLILTTQLMKYRARSTECARVHVVQITHAPAPKLLYSSSAHDRVGPDTTVPTQRECVTQLPDSASIEKHHHDAAVDRRATTLSRNVPRIQQIGPSARRSLPSLRDLASPVRGREVALRVAKTPPRFRVQSLTLPSPYKTPRVPKALQRYPPLRRRAETVLVLSCKRYRRPQTHSRQSQSTPHRPG